MKKYNNYCVLLMLLTLQGCSSYFGINQPVNWGDDFCPDVLDDQIDDSGLLKFQEGKTKRCQLKPYVRDMVCYGIVEDLNNGKDIICEDVNGKKVLFLFDSNDVLESYGNI